MSRRRRQELTIPQAFAGLKADYQAAKTSRYRRSRAGVGAAGYGADYHYRSEADYLRLMELARDYDRNDGVVGQGITRLIDNVIQDGIALDPETGDQALDADLKARWDAWAEDPDACHSAQEMDFHALERLALRSVIVDGDVFFLPLRDGQLQPVEAHRCRTPSNTTRNVVHGVLLDDQRRRLEYWFTRDEIDPLRPVQRVADMRTYRARDAEGARQVLHIYNPKRLSQTRGVTALAPIADFVGLHDDIEFAKLVQQQVASCFAVLRSRSIDYGGPSSGPQYGERESEVQGDGSVRIIDQIAPGMEIAGAPGETLSGFSPAVPNPEFFEQARLVLTFVAVNLHIPLAVLLLDPSMTNFSGWRGAIDQARIGFRQIQQWLTASFHRHVYRWKVRQWLAEDAALRSAAGRGVRVDGHHWNSPTWAYIEPYRDAAADLLRVRNWLISPRRLHAERGREWREIVDETVADNALLVRRAVEEARAINTTLDAEETPIQWRELLSLHQPVPAERDRDERKGDSDEGR